jgi:hypothetical protein
MWKHYVGEERSGENMGVVYGVDNKGHGWIGLTVYLFSLACSVRTVHTLVIAQFSMCACFRSTRLPHVREKQVAHTEVRDICLPSGWNNRQTAPASQPASQALATSYWGLQQAVPVQETVWPAHRMMQGAKAGDVLAATRRFSTCFLPACRTVPACFFCPSPGQLGPMGSSPEDGENT